MVEKISPMKRGKNNTLQSWSANLFYLRKKETTLLEADVDTVSVIEDGKSSLKPLQLQRVLMAVRIPVMNLLRS